MKTQAWELLPPNYTIGFAEVVRLSNGVSVVERSGYYWQRSDGYRSMFFPTRERAVASSFKDAAYQRQIAGIDPIIVEKYVERGLEAIAEGRRFSDV